MDTATHFWQYLWSGRKRWRVLAPSDWHRLFREDAWRRTFFPDVRCSGAFGEAAATAARCDEALDGAAVDLDAFDDDALRERAALYGTPLTVYEGVLRAGELLFIPAGSPHQVMNEATATAVTMNFIDDSNAEEAASARLAESDTHPKFRSRLRKNGVTVPGSSTRWYERFRMPWEGEEDRRRRLVTKLARRSSSRPDAPSLEAWSTFSKRWWNLNLTAHDEY